VSSHVVLIAYPSKREKKSTSSASLASEDVTGEHEVTSCMLPHNEYGYTQAPLTRERMCLLHIPLHDRTHTVLTSPTSRDPLHEPVLRHPSTITTVVPRDHARTPQARHNLETCNPFESPDTLFRDSGNRQSIVKLGRILSCFRQRSPNLSF
jgi:hypothetical protein